jgi:hypothetical protein
MIMSTQLYRPVGKPYLEDENGVATATTKSVYELKYTKIKEDVNNIYVTDNNDSHVAASTAELATLYPEVIKDYPTMQGFLGLDTFTKGFNGWSYHNQANQALMCYAPTLSSTYSQRGQSLALYTPAIAGGKTWARKGQGTPMIPQNASKIILFYEFSWRSYVDLYGLYRINFTLDTQRQADLSQAGKRRWLKLSWLNSVGGSSSNWHRKWQYDYSFADSVSGTDLGAEGFLFEDPAGAIQVNGVNYTRRTAADFAGNAVNLYQDADNTGMTANSLNQLGWVDIPNGKHDFCYNEKHKATFARMAFVLNVDDVNSQVTYETLYSHGMKLDLSALPTKATNNAAYTGEYLNFYENGMNIVLQCENRGVGTKPQSSLHIDLASTAIVYK